MNINSKPSFRLIVVLQSNKIVVVISCWLFEKYVLFFMTEQNILNIGLYLGFFYSIASGQFEF